MWRSASGREVYVSCVEDMESASPMEQKLHGREEKLRFRGAW